MTVEIGIIGLSQSGKTSVFNALTGGAGQHGEGPASHVGIAIVPEPRLDALIDMFQPKKVVPAEARYLDAGAAGKGLSPALGFAGELLKALAPADVLIDVVRLFSAPDVAHPGGSLDAIRDITAMEAELALADLAIIEKRLERLEPSLRSARPAERTDMEQGKEILLRLRGALEGDTPLRELDFSPAEGRLLAGFGFLTAKPILFLINIGEEDIPNLARIEAELGERFPGSGRALAAACARLEMEFAQLDAAAAADFRADYGLTQSGSGRALQLSYELADLISFFTVASGEISVRSVPRGTTAPRAAGRIHSDMERGFIRAEVISYGELINAGSMAEAKRQGKLRLEGKDYLVREGDVITFLFNV